MYNFALTLAKQYPEYADFFINHQKELEKIMNTISKDIYFPVMKNIFNFAKTPISEIESVFVGMDPYPSWKNVDYYDFIDDNEVIALTTGEKIVPEATGRSFEVRSIDSWNEKFKQTSLRNILKALYYLKTKKLDSLTTIRKNINNGLFIIDKPHEWFDLMEGRGVVFLNASLTVKMDEPNSHEKLWNNFMTNLVIYINNKNPDIKWILAGKAAETRFAHLVNNPIISSHPRINKFITECPFSRVDLTWM